MILVEITTIIITITTTVVEVITVMVREVPMGAVAVGVVEDEAATDVGSVVDPGTLRANAQIIEAAAVEVEAMEITTEVVVEDIIVATGRIKSEIHC